jgi:hypothetical protein
MNDVRSSFMDEFESMSAKLRGSLGIVATARAAATCRDEMLDDEGILNALTVATEMLQKAREHSRAMFDAYRAERGFPPL